MYYLKIQTDTQIKRTYLEHIYFMVKKTKEFKKNYATYYCE